MHGDLSQGQRQRALERFDSGKVTTLIATDVAARGLDLDDVTHVINFDPPEDGKAYTHRVGRTGRAGRSGTGVTLVLPEQQADIEPRRAPQRAAGDVRRDRDEDRAREARVLLPPPRGLGREAPPAEDLGPDVLALGSRAQRGCELPADAEFVPRLVASPVAWRAFWARLGDLPGASTSAQSRPGRLAGHVKKVSSCEYGGTHMQRRRAPSGPATSSCQAPGGISTASPSRTSRDSPSTSRAPPPATMR